MPGLRKPPRMAADARLGAAFRSLGLRPKRAHPERDFQIAVEAFLRLAWPADLPYTHIPNGELRHPAVAALLKRMGVKPGWSDFIFVMPDATLAALELKRSASLSTPQKSFRDAIKALGARYAVVRTLDEVETTLAAWLATYGRRLTATCKPLKRA